MTMQTPKEKVDDYFIRKFHDNDMKLKLSLRNKVFCQPLKR